MEAKFLSSFFIVITTAVNLQVTLSERNDSLNCSKELVIEIWKPPEPVHCKDPSKEVRILVEFGHALYYLNETTCEEITFKCTFNRPLTWNYDGVGIPAIEHVKLITDYNDDCYRAFISVQVGSHVQHGKNSIGRYTCSSLYAQDNQTDYVQIFKADTDQIALVQPVGISTNISHDASRELIIPCMTNWPYVHPKIKKETAEGFVQMDASEYDSGTGFHLKFDTKNPSDALGTYMCEMGTGANATRTVFNVQENGDLGQPFQSDEIVINITRGETCSRFTCGTGNKLEYELAFFPCRNIKHCAYQIRYAQLAAEFPQESTFKEICDEYSAPPGSLVRDKTRSGILICREKGGNKYNFAYHYQLVKAPPLATYPEAPKSLKPQRGEIMEGTIDASVLNKTYFVNETLQVSTCYVSEFFYAERPTWLVGLNGSTVKSWGNVTLSRQQGITILKHTIDIRSAEIQSLICAAPRWDTHEWVNLTFPLKVKSGTPPKILNSSAQTLYANGSEKVDFIFVKFMGEPSPGIICTKDGNRTGGKITQGRDNTWTRLISLKGEPEQVIGLYECAVTNVAGSLIIPFNVVLAPSALVQPTIRKSTVIVTLIGVSLCALIVLSLVIFDNKIRISKTQWWQKMRSCVPFKKPVSPIVADLSLSATQSPPRCPLGTSPANSAEDLSCPRRAEEVENIIQTSYLCSVVNTEDLQNMQQFRSGNFGVVYSICKDGRAFALKRMKNNGNVYSTQLLREISTLEFLGRHENILGFQGVVQQEGAFGDLFIVTDFCRLGDIGRFLATEHDKFLSTVQEDRVFNPPAAEEKNGYVSADAIFSFTTIDFIHWAVDCAAGMEFLASHDYAHGDLAPRNLLLADNGTVKICDFGLSRPLNNENGTPFYLLLNVASAVPWDHYNVEFFETGKITPLTDIWAYGVTMWEIFELGKKPYAKQFKKYDVAFVEALKNGLRLLKPEYATTKIYEVMSSCWKPNPNDRPSFKELGELFQAQLPPGGSQADKRGDYVQIAVFQGTDINSPLLVSTTEDSLENSGMGMSNTNCMVEDSLSTAIQLN